MDPPSCLRLRLRSLRAFFSNLQNVGIHRFECNVEHSPYYPVDGGIKSFSRSFGRWGDTPSKSLAGVCLADTARQDAELESNKTLHNCAKKSGYPMLKCDTCSVKKIVMSSKCCSTVPGAEARETADSLSSGPGGLHLVIPEKIHGILSRPCLF